MVTLKIVYGKHNSIWETQQHFGKHVILFHGWCHQVGGIYNLLSGHFHPSRSSVRLSSFVWINPPNSTLIGDFHTISCDFDNFLNLFPQNGISISVEINVDIVDSVDNVDIVDRNPL